MENRKTCSVRRVRWDCKGIRGSQFEEIREFTVILKYTGIVPISYSAEVQKPCAPAVGEGKVILYMGHQKGRIPAKNGLSDKIGRDLKKRGFKYLGSVTVYSHLQACGMINDHTETEADPDTVAGGPKMPHCSKRGMPFRVISIQDCRVVPS